MTPSKKSKKEDLLAEVLGVGAGEVHDSAMGAKTLDTPPIKKIGRPPREPTIPFTLRLNKTAAGLLQQLVGDLQARAIRGEFPRSDATIGNVVEQGLYLYAREYGLKRPITD